MTLKSKDNLTLSLKDHNISTWTDLVEFLQHLPYGRTTNRTNLSLVLKEQRGTCSSKHAFLKHIANLNSINADLILGMYKMNSLNTPKIGNVLKNTNIEYIPEAHCYLKINGEPLDYTSSNSDFNRLKNDILLENSIEPHQVAKFKVEYQKMD
jgi:hypothetical protein